MVNVMRIIILTVETMVDKNWIIDEIVENLRSAIQSQIANHRYNDKLTRSGVYFSDSIGGWALAYACQKNQGWAEPDPWLDRARFWTLFLGLCVGLDLFFFPIVWMPKGWPESGPTFPMQRDIKFCKWSSHRRNTQAHGMHPCPGRNWAPFSSPVL